MRQRRRRIWTTIIALAYIVGISGPPLLAPATASAASGHAVGSVSVVPVPATAAAAGAAYTIAFTATSGLAVSQAVYVQAPAGTQFLAGTSHYRIDGTVPAAVYGGGGGALEVLTGPAFAPVAGGGQVTLTAAGVTNPPAGSETLTLWTSADPTAAMSAPYAIEPANARAVAGVGVQISPATAHAVGSYLIGFTVGVQGALAADSTIRLVGPPGTAWPQAAADYSLGGVSGGTLTVVSAAAVPTGASPTPNDVLLTLGGSGAVLAGATASVLASGVGNPGAGPATLTVATSADPVAATSATYEVVAAPTAVGGVSVALNPRLAGGTASYIVSFTSSVAGTLLGSPSVTLVGPPGMSWPADAGAYTLADAAGAVARDGVYVAAAVPAAVGGSTTPNQVTLALTGDAARVDLPAGDTMTLTVHSVGNPGAGAYNLTVSTSADTLAAVSPTYGVGAATPGTVTEFTPPWANGGADPYGVALGRDGAIWFTDRAANAVGRFDPVSATFTRFALPTANASPTELAVAPNGAIWFVEQAANRIGRLDPASGAVHEYALPTANAGLSGIAVAPDGTAWFTEANGDRLGSVDPTTGAVREYPIPFPDAAPQGIVVRGDGAVWFGEGPYSIGGAIGRFDPATGTFSSILAPTAGDGVERLTAGADGAIWFTSLDGNVGRVDPATDVVSTFPVPAEGSGRPTLRFIAPGPDGNLWFTESQNGQSSGEVGVLDRATGAVVQYPLLASYAVPQGLAAGPGGNLWVAENGRLARVRLPAAVGPVSVAVSPAVPGAAATYTLTFDAGSGGQLSAGSGTITLSAPPGTAWPASAGAYGIDDATRSAGSGGPAAAPVRGATPSTVTLTVARAVYAGDHLTLTVSGVGNPPVTPHAVLSVATSAAPTAVSSAPYAIGRPAAPQVTELGVPARAGQSGDAQPRSLALGPHGQYLWFTAAAADAIGRLNPATGAIVEYAVPTPNAWPTGITLGPGGDLWFTELGDGDPQGQYLPNRIGRIDPSTGAITEYAIPTAFSGPLDIAAGPGGDLWFTEAQKSKVAKLDPATGTITEYTTPSSDSGPARMVAGPGGDMWFLEPRLGHIAKLVPATGKIVEYPLGIQNPQALAVGPSGDLWVGSGSQNVVGRFDPANDQVDVFPMPATGSGTVGFLRMIAAPDGELWATEFLADAVARINPATGTVTQIELPGSYAAPWGLALGPGDALWVGMSNTSAIAKLLLPPAVSGVSVAPSPAQAGATGATYTVDFTTSPDGALQGGVGSVILQAPAGTVWPAAAADYTFTDATSAAGSGAVQAAPVLGNGGATVQVTVPGDIGAGDRVTLTVSGVTNPATPATETLTLSTSSDTSPVSAAPYGIAGASSGLPMTLFPVSASPNYAGRLGNRGPLAGIAAGADGRLWFAEVGSDAIGAATTTGATYGPFAVPTAGAQPLAVAAGPNGGTWFTESNAAKVGRFDPASGQITEYAAPTAGSTPGDGIAAGPDGRIWYVNPGANAVTRFDPVTHASIEFGVPNGFYQESGLTVGPGGRHLWFGSGPGGSFIGRITPASGAISEFALPFASGATSLTAGPDGGIWFIASSYQSGNLVGRLDPTSGGVTYVSVPTQNPQLAAIATGPGGNIWFTEFAGDKIGQIDPTTGQVREYPVPVAYGASPQGITAGPDGNVYFTDSKGIVQIALAAALDTGALDGTVTSGAGGVPGAGVQACRTSGSPCGTALSGPAGGFQMDGLPSGRYVVTVLPPSDRSDLSPAVAGPFTLSAPGSAAIGDVVLHAKAPPLPGVSLDSPTFGKQSSSGFTLFWNEPTQLTAFDPPGAAVEALLTTTNTATGVPTTVQVNFQQQALGGYLHYSQYVDANSADWGVVIDGAGDIYVSDTAENHVYRIAPDGTETVYAGLGGIGQAGAAGYAGDGGLATAAELNGPTGLAVDAAGDLFIADTGNNVIREVSAATGMISTVAGDGQPGFSGENVDATGASGVAVELDHPEGVAVDASGDLFIADTGNDVIREVQDGTIYTLAGTPGVPGYTGDGGPATAATFSAPQDLALDPQGDVFVADTGNGALREIAFGAVNTLVRFGRAGAPDAVAYDPVSGLVYFSPGTTTLGGAFAASSGYVGALQPTTGTVRAVETCSWGPVFRTINPGGGLPSVTDPLASAPPTAWTENTGAVSTCDGPQVAGPVGVGGLPDVTGIAVVQPGTAAAPIGRLSPAPVSSGGLYVVQHGVSAYTYPGLKSVDRPLYTGTIPPLKPLHGTAQLTIAVSAPVPPDPHASSPTQQSLAGGGSTGTATGGGSQGGGGAGQPAVTAISPTYGSKDGGTTVTVSGSGFAPGDTVAFGDSGAVSVSVTSAGQLTAVSPPGDGTVDVTVTSPAGKTSPTGTQDEFTYSSEAPEQHVPALLVYSTGALDFGKVIKGEASDAQTITITNVGEEDAHIGPVSVLGGNAGDFHAESDCGKLGGGEDCKITVTFTPGGLGARGAGLLIPSDVGDYAVALGGYGTSKLILKLGPDPISFGKVAYNTSKHAAVTVTNTSKTLTAHRVKIAIGGNNAHDFTTTTDTCSGATIPPGGTCGFTLVFTPSAVSPQKGSGNTKGTCTANPNGKAVPESAEITVSSPADPVTAQVTGTSEPPQSNTSGGHPSCQRPTNPPSPPPCPSSGCGGGGGGGGGFIDPAGTVTDASGSPISGATVTILAGPGASGPFTAVPDGSPSIQPPTNPEITGPTGEFDWLALAGYYQISASKACGSGGAKVTTSTPTFKLPPPEIGTHLVLPCAAQTLAATTTTLSGSPGAPTAGDTVTLTAAATSATPVLSSGGSPAVIAPTGTVVFEDGGAVLATVPVVEGAATFATASLGAGTHSLTAVYSGDGNYASSTSTPLSLTVGTPPPVPAVAAISPQGGPAAGGTTVTITGSGFTGATAVRFGPLPATSFSVVSDTELQAVTPAGGGSVAVTVAGPGGRSANAATNQFTYAPAVAVTVPTVASVRPGTGPAGTPVTIVGTGFANDSTVAFGSTAAQAVAFVSPTTLVATAPAGNGSVDVTVSTGGVGSVPVAADQFTYTTQAPAPAVTGVTPDSASAAGGTQVTITGQGFAGASAVDFGPGDPAPAFSVDPAGDAVTATVPAGTAGKTVDVTVTGPGGTSADNPPADQFTWTAAPAAPAVASVSPDAGPAAGGTTVTIKGTALTGASAVDFGAHNPASSFTVNADGSITAVSPAGPAGTTVDVRVTTPGGASAADPTLDGFTYQASAPVPAVGSVSPDQGSPGGGTTVTITGAHLQGASAVDFGAGNPAAKFTVSADGSSITAVSPPGTPGSVVDVTVTTAGGTSPDNPPHDQFTYTAGSGAASLTLKGFQLEDASHNPLPANTVLTVGQQYNLTFTVGSQAASALSPQIIAEVTLGGQVIFLNAVQEQVGAGGSVTLSVLFSPQEAGALTATFLAWSSWLNLGGAPLSQPLTVGLTAK